MPSASRSFPPTPESVGRARRFTGRTLAFWGADSLDDDVRTVVSELATNALLHAHTGFTLTLTLDRDLLRLTMADGSVTPPRMRRFDSAESTTGRGLRMIAHLARAWGVEQEREGKAVWCEFPRNATDRRAAEGSWGVLPDPGDGELDVDAFLAAYGEDDDRPPGPQLSGSRSVQNRALVGSVA